MTNQIAWIDHHSHILVSLKLSFNLQLSTQEMISCSAVETLSTCVLFIQQVLNEFEVSSKLLMSGSHGAVAVAVGTGWKGSKPG